MLVSILVMLEVKWKDSKRLDSREKSLSFNPCYVGSKMESNSLLSTNRRFPCFNPCYVGSKMESIRISDSTELVDGFQSLLCWK